MKGGRMASQVAATVATTNYQWFVDTMGHPGSNRLANDAVGEENASESLQCTDGIKRDLWAFPSYERLAAFQRTADASRFPYGVYVRKGKYGRVRRWNFHKRSRS
jgi:hypothetical protein